MQLATAFTVFQPICAIPVPFDAAGDQAGMFETDAVEDGTREHPAAPVGTGLRARVQFPAPLAVILPKISIRLRTDGRHFFFAPGIWSA